MAGLTCDALSMLVQQSIFMNVTFMTIGATKDFLTRTNRYRGSFTLNGVILATFMTGLAIHLCFTTHMDIDISGRIFHAGVKITMFNPVTTTTIEVTGSTG